MMEDFWNIDENAWEGTPQQTQGCDAPGCNASGAHKAPKSRDTAQDYYWFCLEHVQEYNRCWDYFDGMGRTEIESFMREAETGHRPTWKTTERATPRAEDLASAVYRMFGEGGPRQADQPPPRHDISPELHKALAVLDMDYPVTLTEIKQQYKQLVKKHHPDAARSGKHSEETFKRITQAYQDACKLLREEEEDRP